MGNKQNVLKQIRLRQETETWLNTLNAPFGTVLYLCVRSGDSIDSATIGQDYVSFCYAEDNLSFAVCDGVGQSFMGDLAARMLGDGLNDWLWEINRPASAKSFSESVAEALNALTKTSARQVIDFRLPEHLPPLVVQALEMQREYGSESMFVAGRVALVEPEPWIALCWLGDSPVAAIDINGELVDLGPKGHTSERWNATSGVKGRVHTWVGSAEHVARVAGYTDGLGLDHVPTDEDLAKLMEVWQSSPPADDASLFDVRLAPSPETTGELLPPQLPQRALLMLSPGAGIKGEQTPALEPGDARPIVVPDEPAVRIPTGETQPIIVDEKQRTPVAGLEPVKPAASDGEAVSGWRPLPGKEEDTCEAEAAITSAQQQIEMWRKAVVDGLTSARLALVMIERLLEQLEQQLSGRIDLKSDDEHG